MKWILYNLFTYASVRNKSYSTIFKIHLVNWGLTLMNVTRGDNIQTQKYGQMMSYLRVVLLGIRYHSTIDVTRFNEHCRFEPQSSLIRQTRTRSSIFKVHIRKVSKPIGQLASRLQIKIKRHLKTVYRIYQWMICKIIVSLLWHRVDMNAHYKKYKFYAPFRFSKQKIKKKKINRIH